MSRCDSTKHKHTLKFMLDGKNEIRGRKFKYFSLHAVRIIRNENCTSPIFSSSNEQTSPFFKTKETQLAKLQNVLNLYYLF